MERGVTRLVFGIGNVVIKVPNFLYSHKHFLNGCYANWSERCYTKMFENMPEYDKIAPTIFCSVFGLVSIQKRVQILDRELTDDECVYFKEQTTDCKGVNFGYYKGRLVCVDYI